jgi:hypothetical protein
MDTLFDIPPSLVRFAKPYYDKHDESHGWSHILRVLEFVRKIQAVIMPNITHSYLTTLIYAIVLHDIADHKYAKTREEQTNLRLEMFRFVISDVGPVSTSAILAISTGITYSNRKEVDAEVQRDKTFWIADHVSLLNMARDADMIDAINLQRSYGFHIEWLHESRSDAKKTVCKYWESTLKHLPNEMHFGITHEMALKAVVREECLLKNYI